MIETPCLLFLGDAPDPLVVKVAHGIRDWGPGNALAMDREMRARGLKATFRAIDQTGILITGDGVPLDAVVADFTAGAVDWLTPDNDPDHWDLIEAQGSLFHVS